MVAKKRELAARREMVRGQAGVTGELRLRPFPTGPHFFHFTKKKIFITSVFCCHDSGFFFAQLIFLYTERLVF